MSGLLWEVGVYFVGDTDQARYRDVTDWWRVDGILELRHRNGTRTNIVLANTHCYVCREQIVPKEKTQ